MGSHYSNVFFKANYSKNQNVTTLTVNIYSNAYMLTLVRNDNLRNLNYFHVKRTSRREKITPNT